MKGLLTAVRESRQPREEIRFGTILNGGVSLAVWMGGAAHELDRLTKARERDHPSDPYAALLDLVGSNARVDVLAGTSAGGINGAALALAQVNRKADLSLLRELWIGRGRFESLLRRPFEGNPTSLLQGDDYFLPALNEAMNVLGHQEGYVDPATAPLDLIVTTTVLGGNQTISLDSMGQELPQTVHSGRFRWQRHARLRPRDDPFAPENIDVTAAQLALAARSTASFPVAFEPSFVPVGSADFPVGSNTTSEDAARADKRLRPDMSQVVRSWGTKTSGDRSRYTVDGGVLANTPTLDALRAVESMEARGPVRRVMLLVYPHAPTPEEQPASTREEAPTTAEALSGTLGALTGEGGRTFVDQIEAHNRRAAGRRDTRSDILHGTTPAELDALCQALYPHFKERRVRRAARVLAARISGSVDDGTTSKALPTGWNYERVRLEAERAQQMWLSKNNSLPYAPADPPQTPKTQEAPQTETDETTGWVWGFNGALGIIEAAGELLHLLVASLSDVDNSYQKVTEARASVFALRTTVEMLRDALDAAWKSDTGDEFDAVMATLAPDKTYWLLRLVFYDYLLVGDVTWDAVSEQINAVAQKESDPVGSADSQARLETVAQALLTRLQSNAHRAASPREDTRGVVGSDVAYAVAAVVQHLLEALRALSTESANRDFVTSSGLNRWLSGLGLGPGNLPDADTLLTRLLRLDIAATMLAEESLSGANTPVELVQLSAQTDNHFARNSRTADDKLGGWSIHRFGGFLKRSWRANDWAWGRMDAATVLSRTVLHPGRVRRAALHSRYLHQGTAKQRAESTVAELVEELFGGQIPEGFEGRVAAAQDELAVVLADLPADPAADDEVDLPASMPALADLFARAVHEEAVVEELPELAKAIRADRVDGGNQRSHGEVFLAANQPLLSTIESAASPRHDDLEASRLSGQVRHQALKAFDAAGVGRESLREEASSDTTIRTASAAVAVLATVASSRRSGLRALAPLARALRGLVLLPYWVVTGLTSRGGGIARGLALLSLGTGAAILALSLFGVLPEQVAGPAAGVGASAVLVAFGYAALRTGTLLHGVVLLTPLIPLLTYSFVDARRASQADGGAAATQGGVTLAVVVALGLALALLGSIGAGHASVWATLDRLADRQGVPQGRLASFRRGRALGWMAFWLIPLGLAIALSSLLARAIQVDWIGHFEDWAWPNIWKLAIVLATAAGMLMVGAVVAYVAGRSLRALPPAALAADPGSKSDAARFQPVVNPRGIAVGWSVTYGACYEGITVLLLFFGDHTQLWHRTALITAAVFALALVIVVPIVLPVLEFRDISAAEKLRTRSVSTHAEYASSLVARGRGYRLLVTEGSNPSLTWWGRRLFRSLGHPGDFKVSD